MYETNEEGVYTIERMTTAQIAKEKYSIGMVRTSTATSKTDWTEIENYYVNAEDELVAGTTPEYKNVEGSSYYNLSYTFNGTWQYDADKDGVKETYNDYNAKISQEDDDMDVLDEKVTEKGNEYNNTVLVAYNSKDEIVYAISFAHLDDTKGNPIGSLNYALAVWMNLLDQEVAEEDNAVVALTNEIKTITEITEANKAEAQELVDSVAAVDTTGASAKELKELQDAAAALQTLIDTYTNDTLTAARNAKKAAVDLKGFDTEVADEKADYDKAIDEAETVEAVNAVDATELENAVATALSQAKTIEIGQLKPYTASDYSRANYAKITEAQDAAKKAINDADNKADIDGKAAACNEITDAILTLAQEAAEEVAKANQKKMDDAVNAIQTAEISATDDTGIRAAVTAEIPTESDTITVQSATVKETYGDSWDVEVVLTSSDTGVEDVTITITVAKTV